MSFQDLCYDAIQEAAQNEESIPADGTSHSQSESYSQSDSQQEAEEDMQVEYILPDVYSQGKYLRHNYDIPNKNNGDYYYTINANGTRNTNDSGLDYIHQYTNDSSNSEPLYLNLNLPADLGNDGDENYGNNSLMPTEISPYFHTSNRQNAVLPSHMPNNYLNYTPDEYMQNHVPNMSDDVNPAGGVKLKVNKNEIFMTKTGDGKIVEAVTMVPYKTRAQVDIEALEEAKKAERELETVELTAVIIPECKFGIHKGRKQNLKDNIKQNMELEIFEEGFDSDESDDDEWKRMMSEQNKRHKGKVTSSSEEKTTDEEEITVKKELPAEDKSTTDEEPIESNDDDGFKSNEETDEKPKSIGSNKCPRCNTFFMTSGSLVIHRDRCEAKHKTGKKNNPKNLERKSLPIANITNAANKLRTIANEKTTKPVIPKKNFKGFNIFNSSLDLTTRPNTMVPAGRKEINKMETTGKHTLPVRRLPTSTVTSNTVIDNVRQSLLKDESQKLKVSSFKTLYRDQNKKETGKKIVAQSALPTVKKIVAQSALPTVKKMGSRPQQPDLFSISVCEHCNKVLPVSSTNSKNRCTCRKPVLKR